MDENAPRSSADGADGHSRTSTIHKAAARGDVQEVQRFIDAGASLLSLEDGFSPLSWAAFHGHTAVCTLLCQALTICSDAAGRFLCVFTAFATAAASGHVDAVLTLLDHGFPSNEALTQGARALTVAAAHGHADLCAALLARGVREKLLHALFYATSHGHTGVLQLLLPHCEDVDAVTHEHRTLLTQAVCGGNAAVVKLLLDAGASVHGKCTAVSMSPLQLAAELGACDVIRVLVEAGADVEDASRSKWTPLQHAASGGHVEACRQLVLSHGADVNAGSEAPVVMAASVHVAEVLAGLGARVGLVQVYQRAVVKQQMDMLAWMLDRLPEEEDINGFVGGFTPLCTAAAVGMAENCKLLLDAGADVDARSSDEGFTPLMCTVQENHIDVSRLLLLRGANIMATARGGACVLCYAAMQGHLDLVTLFLSHGAEIEAQDLFGRRPLHYAARTGRADMCTFLVSAGADVNARVAVTGEGSHAGATALIQAAYFGQYEACIALVQAGADVNMLAADGSSALMRAVDYQQWPACVALLRCWGKLSTSLRANVLAIENMPPVEEMVAESLDDVQAHALKRRKHVLLQRLRRIGCSNA